MKENYKSWNINLSEFKLLESEESRLKFLLRFAVLAPSSHNSQPWLFLVNDKIIEVYKNTNKELLIGDPENRLLLISIGCAIKNIKIAADYFDYKITVNYFPGSDDNFIARIIFEKNNSYKYLLKKEEHLVHQITKRSVNRSKYKNTEIPTVYFSLINKQLETVKNISIDWISESHKKEFVGKICAKTSSFVMDKPGFLKELSHYIKNNLTSAKYGIPAFGMGIPTPLSFFAPLLVRFFNMDKLNYQANVDLFKNFTPTIGIISSEADNKIDWILVGEFYQSVALSAEKFNLKTSIWGAPTVLRHEINDIMKSIDLKYNPQLIFRIGYPEIYQPHSPRYSLQELIKN